VPSQWCCGAGGAILTSVHTAQNQKSERRTQQQQQL